VIGVARVGRTNEHLQQRVRDSVQQQGAKTATKKPWLSF
jgi:hypothetical protein